MAGLVTFASNAQLDARDKAAADAAAYAAAQSAPVILGLAAHIRSCWSAAYEAKRPIETRMLKALRQRNGEYEPEKLADIRKTGGSEVFMMITETKCRAAESWLRDILLDEGVVPFALKPTPIPDVPPDQAERVAQIQAQKILQSIQDTGLAPDPELMEDLQTDGEREVRDEIMAVVQRKASAMETQIRDQFAEGGMLLAFDEFLSDLTTYPNAFLKGPIVRRQRSLDWTQDPQGKFVPEVVDKLAPTYSRVDPFRFYVEPGVTRVNDGYTIELHELSEADLSDLIGVPGYDEAAIRDVLANMGAAKGWLWANEFTKNELEGKHSTWRRPGNYADALEFWGRVSGRMLLEMGMDAEDVPDAAKMYDCCAWLINGVVIKATLNYDPLGAKPYKTTSFFRRPGSFWGSCVPEAISDVQAMCNGSARALANNMGIASGPQVEVNVERIAEGESIKTMYPWKIWQTLNDPMGTGQPAIRFNQPDDRSGPLLAVYGQFMRMADDQSGIPAYVYGDGNVGGAGRTASGLSMLMGSAGKGIRQVIMRIDFEVIGPVVTDQFNWNMRYLDDDSIKGDCEIIPRGAVTLANREQLNVRRVEFLQATANPIDAQIVGIPGRAAILREVAKGLSMPVDDIVPSDEKLEIQDKMQQRLQQLEQQAAEQQAMAGQTRDVAIKRGPAGEAVGMTVGPGGSPSGGRDANTVSNKITGRGG